MRTKPYKAILEASRDTGVQVFLGSFSPTIDNKTVFLDYAQRASNGRFVRRPYLIGNNDYEAGLFKLDVAGLNLTISDRSWAIFNQAFFSCPAESAALSKAEFASTYRYRFFGEYPNTRLTSNPDSGAWHGAEIPIIWRTTQDAAGVADTPTEAMVSDYLNAAWSAFAKDPVNALSKAPFSWPRYEQSGNTLIRFGYGNETRASIVEPATYDQACSTLEQIVAASTESLTGLFLADPTAFASLDQFANLTQLGGGSAVGY